LNLDKSILLEFLAAESPPPRRIDTNPFSAALGMTLMEASSKPGRVKLLFAPAELFLQREQVLQGGAVSAMMDFAMAFAAMAALPADRRVTTTMLNVAFLRGAPGGRYEAVGEVEKLGRSVAFTRAVLTAADGSAVATATSSLFIRAREGTATTTTAS